jgi:outer membrane protein OmpA-like peptidoglycan-associated protein
MISTSQKLLSVSLLACLLADPSMGQAEPVPSILELATNSDSSRKTTSKRAKRPKKEGAPKARRLIAELEAKLEQQQAEIEKLKLRIRAGDQAGAELDRRLAASQARPEADKGLRERFLKAITDQRELTIQLTAARALAMREHEQAERISAKIIEQVEAQKTIARDMETTLARVMREREALLAKLEAKAKIDHGTHQRLIAENEKLTKSLKESWAKAKQQEALKAKLDEAAAAMQEQRAALARHEAIAKELPALKRIQARAVEQEAKLKEALASQQRLEKQVQDLAEQKVHEKSEADRRRADMLREQIARKKLEAKLKASEDAAIIAAAAAKKAAAEAVLRDIAPIYFGKNQADSEAQEQSLLAQVKTIHRALPSARFSISCHTCTDGSAARNLALSQKRAQRIADLLQADGIPAASIAEIVGKGETTPVADNATQQGREANRRVEIKVLRE